MAISTKKKILDIIKEKGPGIIYFAEDFLFIANNGQVRLALHRLVKENLLLRLGQGIYVFPKVDPRLGPLRPSIEEVAKAIAARDKITIKSTGANALNQIGISTQVPMKVVYKTEGTSRKIKIGNSLLTFRKTTPKKMAYKGAIVPLIIEAMEELGPDGITDEIRKKFSDYLKHESDEELKKTLKLTPYWIAEEILSLLKDKNV